MLRAIPFFFGGFSLRSAARNFAASVLDWQSRDAERQHLASLDDRLLTDIGLTRADVLAEIRKPFWRL